MALELPLPQSFAAADLVVSPANAEAVALLGTGGWPAGRLLIIGPLASGKSHLAHVWAEGAGAEVIGPAALGDPLGRGPLALDDADLVAGDGAAEEALFHHLNHFAATGLPLLMTARSAPRDWGLGLADLLSRLQATAVVRIAEPDDALLAGVLAKLFADRQVAVPDTVIPYLLARMDRSVEAARALVAALDAGALARGQPITRSLAAEVLAQVASALDSPDRG